jgi:hypothetical protein
MRGCALLRMLQLLKIPAHALSPEGMTGNCPDLGANHMQDQQPTHASTPGEIIDYYDTHPDLTLRELATMTGRTVAYLKGLLNHPEQVKA